MKLNLKLLLAGVTLIVASTAAHAHSFKLGNIDIGHPYARVTVAGQPIGGGFLKLNNRGGDDKLLSATAAVSASVEMHTMNMDGDVMRMRQVDAIPLPAGKTVELKPGGYHLMFVGLKAQGPIRPAPPGARHAPASSRVRVPALPCCWLRASAAISAGVSGGLVVSRQCSKNTYMQTVLKMKSI